MTTLTREQQLVLEDINRARLDPATEAARLGINLNEGVAADRQISATAKQVLAPSVALTSAAQGHSNVLSQNKGVFDNSAPLFTNNDPNQGLTVHTGLGDGTPGSRITASGYVDTRNSGFIQNESVALEAHWGTPTQTPEQILHGRSDFLMTDHWKDQNGVDQAIDGRGHRTSLFQEDIREVGIGVAHSTLPLFGSSALTTSVTENFGRSGNTVFVTGVVYDDTKNNLASHTYGDGTARQGITVTVDGGVKDVTGSGGGWSAGGIGGVHTVTFSGGGLAAPVSVTVDAGQANAKVDLVNGREIDVSANATLGSGAVDLRLLGVANLNATGNAGDNHLIGNRGNNLLDGGAGDDTAVYGGRSSDYRVTKLADGSFQVVDLRAGALDGTDVLKNIEHIQFLGDGAIQNLVATPPPPPPPPPTTITGTDAADSLRGTSGADVMLGLGGDDTLFGSAGADRLDGGTGFDTANYAASFAAISINLATGINHGGDAEGDTLISIERVIGSAFNDTYIGSAGNDSFTGGAGADHIDGGAGFDTASYATSSAGVAIDLSTGIGHFGDAEGDTLINIERVIGSAFNDKLVGSAHNDQLYGGAGGDLLIGGAGADYLNGGSGIDTASYATSSAGVSINLGTGVGHGGDAEGDTLVNIERVIGSDFADSLVGGAGDDTLIGHGGADVLDGGAGFDTTNYGASAAAVTVNLATGKGSGGDAAGDTLISIEQVIGSAFNDKLIGSANADTLDGGAGRDILTGGLGNDTFVFFKGQANGDVITDFAGNGAGAGDMLKFEGYGAGATFHATATPDQYQIDYNGGTQHETITLANHATVHASDVLFV